MIRQGRFTSIKKLTYDALTLYQSGIIFKPVMNFFTKVVWRWPARGNMANSEESPAINVLVEVITV